MKVAVRTFGNLRRFLSEKEQEKPLLLPEYATVRQLLARLEIPENEAWRVSRNGSLVGVDEVLSDADEVSIFAPVGGG